MKISCRTLLLGVFLALVINMAAFPVTVAEVSVQLSSSGIWTSISGGSIYFNTGVNTNEVRWGNPYNSQNPGHIKSGLRFDGQPASFTTGEEFCLGKLTHYNYPITDPASGATLVITLTFTAPQITPPRTFTYNFAIDETDNPPGACGSVTCLYSPCSTIPCPDQVSWNNNPDQSFTYDGNTYTLQITGIKDSCPSGNLLTAFVTQEKKTNEAYLVGKIILAGPAIHIEKTTNGEDADTGTGPTILAGCPVTWKYSVTNAGNVDLRDVSVTDSPTQVVTLIGGNTDNDQWLDKTETWIYQATGTAQSGQYSNTATAKGRMSSSSPYVTDTDPSHYLGQALDLTAPASQTVCDGGTAVFSVTPADTATYDYQWQRLIGSTWTNISAATNPSYSFTAYASDSGKRYRVLVSYKSGSSCEVASGIATLTVRPSITLTGPANQTVCDGASATFSVTATPTNTYNYQWQENSGSGWSNIPGATISSYSVTGTSSNNGSQYRVLVGYDAEGSCQKESNAATLTVRPPITLTGPANQTVCDGASATFSVTATPTNTYNYQWQENSGSGWSNIPGATISSYTVTGTSSNNGSQYRVLVSYDAEGSCQKESNAANLTVLAKAIATAGRPQTICSDGIVTLDGYALNYQTVAWSGGAGIFDPNKNTLNARYTPNATEVAFGSVTLTLTATSNAPCSVSAVSQVNITIEPKPDAKILVIEPISVI
ncbi:MAG: choice-of-anchor K domain-containing protein [Methanothrix sp.]